MSLSIGSLTLTNQRTVELVLTKKFGVKSIPFSRSDVLEMTGSELARFRVDTALLGADPNADFRNLKRLRDLGKSVKFSGYKDWVVPVFLLSLSNPQPGGRPNSVVLNFELIQADFEEITLAESVTDWAKTVAGDSISADTADLREGAASLSWIYDATVGDHDLTYNPAGTWDFTKRGWLGFWLKGDNSGRTLQVHLESTALNFRRWNVTLDFTGWRMILLAREGDGFIDTGTPDFNIITLIRFRINVASGVGNTIKLDEILAYS